MERKDIYSLILSAVLTTSIGSVLNSCTSIPLEAKQQTLNCPEIKPLIFQFATVFGNNNAVVQSTGVP